MESDRFYVTMRDGAKTAWLIGPCYTHELALSLVETARVVAAAANPFYCFNAFGTAKVVWDHKSFLPAGRLNKMIGFDDANQRIRSTEEA
jgi:hypothetical protein